MLIGEISGWVTALEQELKYYKNTASEQAAVIKQLHRGYALPGELTYIHPADMAEILNKIDYVDVFQFTNADTSLSDTLQIKGVRYKQSPFMPQITTNFR